LAIKIVDFAVVPRHEPAPPVRERDAPPPAQPAPPSPPARETRRREVREVDIGGFVRPEPYRRRSGWRRWAVFALMVLLPTVVLGAYFFFVATPRYVSEFRFAVRSQDTGGQASIMAAALGTTQGNNTTDSYIVVDYLRSVEAIDDLNWRTELVPLYSSEDIDGFSRFDPNGSQEDFLNYWRSHVDASYDMMTGIIIVRVQAFAPDDAQRIAAALKGRSEALVNDLSERARADQLQLAQSEVDRTTEQLRQVNQQQYAFMSRTQTVDPTQSASALIARSAELSNQLSALNQTLLQMQSQTPNSPQIPGLRDQIDAARQELARVNAQIGDTTGGTDETQADLVAQYQSLVFERGVAEQALASALTSLDAARARAESQQLFLATFVEPSLPQKPELPKPLLYTILTLLASLGIWLMATLGYHAIRDHG